MISHVFSIIILIISTMTVLDASTIALNASGHSLVNALHVKGDLFFKHPIRSQNVWLFAQRAFSSMLLLESVLLAVITVNNVRAIIAKDVNKDSFLVLMVCVWARALMGIMQVD